MNEDLPDGWKWTTLEALAAPEPKSITDGPFGSNLKTAHYTESGPRVIRLQNIGDGEYRSEDAHISEAHFESLRRHSVEAGDLIVASLGEVLPRACLVPASVPPAIVKADCIRVRLGPEVDPRYVNYALQRPSLRKATATQIKGVGRPRLGMKGIKALAIPLAPLGEQRQIVAAIEKHLAHLEAANAAVRSAERRLEQMVASTLASICSGPWPVEPLSHVIHTLKNGVFVSRPGADPPGSPIYRISAVRPLDLRTDDIRYAFPIPDRADSYVVEAGDLLFTRYSGNPDFVGAAAVVPPIGAGVLHPDKLIRVVVDRTKVLPQWIAAYVAAPAGRREIEMRLKTTAGQVGISGTQLRSVPIAVPPVEYQEHALSRLEAVLDERDRLKSATESATAHAASLRRSIFVAAFSGRLPSEELAA